MTVVGVKNVFQDVLKNETLTLKCGSDDCFAVITYKVSENSTISCINMGKVNFDKQYMYNDVIVCMYYVCYFLSLDPNSLSIVYDIQDISNVKKTTSSTETKTKKSVASPTTSVTTSTKTDATTHPSPTITKPISSATTNTKYITSETTTITLTSKSTKSGAITSMTPIKKNLTTTQTSILISTTTISIIKASSLDAAKTKTTFTKSNSKPTSIINTNTLESIMSHTKDYKIVPQSSKSSYDLVMAPRFLDGQNEEYFSSTATATATKETLKGQINFSTIYKNSSNFLKGCLTLILCNIFVSLPLYYKMFV